MKFRLVVDKARDEEVVATVHAPSALTDKIEALVLEQTGIDRIPAYDDGEWKMLAFSQIECIMIQDGKTYAVDRENRQYRLKMRLYELEERLPATFIRINKSALANKDRLDRFVASYSGAVDAVFKCGYKEFVSRRCFAEIKRRFQIK